MINCWRKEVKTTMGSEPQMFVQSNTKHSSFFMFCFCPVFPICFCRITMAPYPQLLDQQEIAYLDHGCPRFFKFLFHFHWEQKNGFEENNIKDLMSYWQTETSLLFHSPQSELCFLRRGWEGLRWSGGLVVAALTRDRGHACGDHRRGSLGITKNDSHLVLIALLRHSSSGLTLMTSLLQADTCHNLFVEVIHQIICCCSRVWVSQQH